MAGNINIVSYNCRGLPKSKQQLALRPDIVKLLQHNQIIAFQETSKISVLLIVYTVILMELE